ncbi:MAG: NnrS family protein [Steroidobacteraceae bacterium]
MNEAPRFVPFAYGFRPFFLAAGVFAVIAIAAWVWIFAGGGAPLGTLPPFLWHGHEMLFGFIGAAIAGFLLTAVPSWTGSRGFAGTPLVVLTLLWLAGRLAFAAAGSLPPLVLALAELGFLPMLAFMIGRSLLRERNRNFPMLVIIAVLWGIDAWFLYAATTGDYSLASRALRVGIGLVLLLVTVIGGRIVPNFTASALRRRGIAAQVRSRPLVERVTIASMVAVVVVDAVAPSHWLAPVVAAIAAVAHAVRLSGWKSLRTLSDPIVWVLHAAYAWLPIGFALKAVHLATGAAFAFQWQHALTIGTAATMILAVTTRAALGHTGRPLVVSRGIGIAYVLLLLAALVRVFGPALVPADYLATIEAAALLWIAAFAIYTVIYAPILTLSRVDQKSG